MSKYITIKVTQDQLDALISAVSWRYDLTDDSSEQESFHRRLLTKLAKAKS